MKNNPLLIKVLSIIFAVLILLLGIYWDKKTGQNFKNQILKDPIFFSGTLIGIKKAYKHPDAFEYQFYDSKSQLRTSSSTSGMDRSRYPEFLKRLQIMSFPVIASKDEPEKYNFILICKKDFEGFDLPFPDSLMWVEWLINK